MKDIVLRNYRKKDAESLMRMWRETTHLWPMGAPHPTELTPDEFHRRMAGTGALKHWVAEDTAAGRIVAYCAFSRDTVIPEHMEVSLINTHPDWQGRGIGKALLMKCIDTTAAMGFPALFLGTWPGNEAACGLYKRLGFFHKPDTNIGFVNFIPSVLQCPMLQPYLNRKNWYRALKRDTSYGPDDHRNGAMRVYPYRFETRKGVVEVGFERYSNGLYRVKIPDAGIALTVDYDKGWKGFDRVFTVNVSGRSGDDGHGGGAGGSNGSRGGKSRAVWSVEYSGAHGLAESGRMDCVTRETLPVRVPADLDLEAVHMPRLQMAVFRDGVSMARLSCGIQPVEPVEVYLFDDEGIVPAGVPVGRTLNLTNNLDRDITVEMDVIAPEGITVTPDRIRKRLPAGATRGVEVTLQAQVPSAHICLEGSIDGSGEKLPPQRMPVGAWSPMQPAWIEKRETILVENGVLRFMINKRRCLMAVMPRSDLQCAIGVLPATLGPPYPNYGADGEPAFTITGDTGRILVDMRIPSRQFRGAVVSQRFTLDSGPLVTMESDVTFDRPVPGGVKIRQRIIEASFRRTTVLPVSDGLLRLESYGACGSMNQMEQSVFRDGELWAAVESRDTVAGCFWAETCPDMEFGSYFLVTMNRPVRIRNSGSRLSGIPLWFYAGPGSAESIREIWYRLRNEKIEPVESRPAAWIADRIVRLESGADHLSLTLSTAVKQAMDYTVSINAEPRLRISPRRVRVTSASHEHPAAFDVPLDHPEVRPGVSLLTGSIHAGQWSAPVSVPVIACGGSRVEHQCIRHGRRPVHRLSSGPLEIDIAPGWPGQVIGIRWRGIETLNRMFPETGVLGFEKPFYGGLYPTVLSGQLNQIHRIRGRAVRVEETDAVGLTWQGVSVRSRVPKDHDMAGARVQCRYLVSPQVPVFRVVVDVWNRTGKYTPSVIMAVLAPFMPPMDAPMTVRYESQGLPLEYRRGNEGESVTFDNFLTLEYGGHRPDMSLLVMNDTDYLSDGIDTGEGDFYLYLTGSRRLKQGQSQRLEFWIGFDDIGRGLQHFLGIQTDGFSGLSPNHRRPNSIN